MTVDGVRIVIGMPIYVFYKYSSGAVVPYTAIVTHTHLNDKTVEARPIKPSMFSPPPDMSNIYVSFSKRYSISSIEIYANRRDRDAAMARHANNSFVSELESVRYRLEVMEERLKPDLIKPDLHAAYLECVSSVEAAMRKIKENAVNG